MRSVHRSEAERYRPFWQKKQKHLFECCIGAASGASGDVHPPTKCVQTSECFFSESWPSGLLKLPDLLAHSERIRSRDEDIVWRPRAASQGVSWLKTTIHADVPLSTRWNVCIVLLYMVSVKIVCLWFMILIFASLWSQIWISVVTI